MATISGNGGAERYWRRVEQPWRLVRCRNGVLLVQLARGARWHLTDELIARDPSWVPDASQAARAAVTRTGRTARRREEV